MVNPKDVSVNINITQDRTVDKINEELKGLTDAADKERVTKGTRYLVLENGNTVTLRPLKWTEKVASWFKGKPELTQIVAQLKEKGLDQNTLKPLIEKYLTKNITKLQVTTKSSIATLAKAVGFASKFNTELTALTANRPIDAIKTVNTAFQLPLNKQLQLVQSLIKNGKPAEALHILKSQNNFVDTITDLKLLTTTTEAAIKAAKNNPDMISLVNKLKEIGIIKLDIDKDDKDSFPADFSKYSGWGGDLDKKIDNYEAQYESLEGKHSNLDIQIEKLKFNDTSFKQVTTLIMDNKPEQAEELLRGIFTGNKVSTSLQFEFLIHITDTAKEKTKNNPKMLSVARYLTTITTDEVSISVIDKTKASIEAQMSTYNKLKEDIQEIAFDQMMKKLKNFIENNNSSDAHQELQSNMLKRSTHPVSITQFESLIQTTKDVIAKARNNSEMLPLAQNLTALLLSNEIKKFVNKEKHIIDLNELKNKIQEITCDYICSNLSTLIKNKQPFDIYQFGHQIQRSLDLYPQLVCPASITQFEKLLAVTDTALRAVLTDKEIKQDAQRSLLLLVSQLVKIDPGYETKILDGTNLKKHSELIEQRVLLQKDVQMAKETVDQIAKEKARSKPKRYGM